MPRNQQKPTPHEGVKRKWVRRGKIVVTSDLEALQFTSLRKAKRYWRTGK